MSDFKSKLGEKYKIEELSQDVEPLASQFQRFLKKAFMVFGIRQLVSSVVILSVTMI